jgi:hypothetical protein
MVEEQTFMPRYDRLESCVGIARFMAAPSDYGAKSLRPT